MTSNLGSDIILNDDENHDGAIMKLLKSTFRPELINRIDEIVIFNSLSKDVIYEVLDRLIKDLNKRLAHMHFTINISNAAKDYIIDNSYSKEFGARPIKRYITKNVETLLANAILNETVHEGDHLTIDVRDDVLVINREN